MLNKKEQTKPMSLILESSTQCTLINQPHFDMVFKIIGKTNLFPFNLYFCSLFLKSMREMSPVLRKSRFAMSTAKETIGYWNMTCV